MLPSSPAAASTADPLPVVNPPACDCPQRVALVLAALAAASDLADLDALGVQGTWRCRRCGRLIPHTGTARQLGALVKRAGQTGRKEDY